MGTRSVQHLPVSTAVLLQRAFGSATAGLSGCVSYTKSDTPIYTAMVRDAYAKKAKAAYDATPDMIGCGQWELIPPNGYCRTHARTHAPTGVRDLRERRVRLGTTTHPGTSTRRPSGQHSRG
jgi:hypothetical protein